MKIDPMASARRPQQRRALERFDRIVDAAEALLAREGLRGFSIPALAQRLRFTRGSIYTYFPTPYALFNELAERYLGRIFSTFAEMPELADLPWRDGVRRGVDAAAQFYNAHRVARMLILGGAVTDASFRAQELTIKQIADLGRNAWKTRGVDLPAEPDVATLAIDLGMACFRRSVFAHGEITPAYREMAADVMVVFLEPHVEAGGDKKTRRAKKAAPSRLASRGRRR